MIPFTIISLMLLCVSVLNAWLSWRRYWEKPDEFFSIVSVFVCGLSLMGVFLSVAPVTSYVYAFVEEPICIGPQNECELVASTNPFYTRGLYSVHFDSYPVAHLFELHFVNKDLAGAYYSYDSAIDIRSSSEYYHVWFHELGHHVFLKVLDSSERDRYVDMYRSSLAALNNTGVEPRNQFVSEYSMTSASEDFAETFAALVSKTGGGSHDKMRFVKELLITHTGCDESCVLSEESLPKQPEEAGNQSTNS